jgi:hypothetical protein
MTCSEFQKELPEFMEEGGSTELHAHLKGCTNCSGLVTSLQTIVSEARYLQATEEPSPRVWNSIEIILRQEKLIRDPQPSGRHSIIPSLRQRWGIGAWLVPAAAAILIAAGFVVYQQHPKGRLADNAQPVTLDSVSSGAKSGADLSDQQLLQEVSVRAPLMRAAYESNLKDVNDYIRDAQDSVNANPNDEEAQQALMDAYGQKSMIYEMALDRSLP